MRRILVAIDGSDASERVAEFVNGFFGPLDVEVIGVNIGAVPLPWGPHLATPGAVYPWLYLPGGPPPGSTEGGDDRAVEAEGEAVLARSDLESDQEVVEIGGDVADVVRRVAEERDVEVIVVGTGHKGLLERLVAPSVSAELARSAPTPVLIVH